MLPFLGITAVSATAQQYLSGLMQADKRHMERMAEVVPDSDDQVLQNFLVMATTLSYRRYRDDDKVMQQMQE